LSFGAAAVTELVKHHVVSGNNGGGVCLLCAIASKVSLSVDYGISAAAPNHVSIWGNESLAHSQW
jgi:hypothetical protein